MQELPGSPRSTAGTALLFLKGMAMGAADSVPGVSGGTIAFISNIYDELLASIRACNPATLGLLFSEGPRALWRAVNGAFLLPLLLGIVLALVISANLVTWLLAEHYSYLMCFFNGLILASLWYLGTHLERWNTALLLAFAGGLGLSLAVALAPSLAGSTHPLYYFGCGAVAICAMLLPGISGAFILLLLGAYAPVLNALRVLDWSVILVFGAGCLCGLMSFSRLLTWLLSRFRQPTLAFLLGVLAGSLYLLWPWRASLTEEERGLNLAPGAYDVLTGMPISPMLALLLLLGGFGLVLGLEWAGRKFSGKSSSSAA